LPSEIEAGCPALAPGSPGDFGHGFKEARRLFMQIIVRDNNVDQALRALKKKLQREGVYREMKLRRHYEKPSEKRARERAAAIRRARKLERKRVEREGAR
jgi:small subunit ribosomal protein S21